MTGAPLQGTLTATLELIASERPELLDFQLEVLLSSSVRLLVFDLAAACHTPLNNLGPVILKACRDLDALEKARRIWNHPAQIVQTPNVAALQRVCAARMGRARAKAHLRRLETVHDKLERHSRKLESDRQHAESRARIEAFLGPSQDDPPTPEGA